MSINRDAFDRAIAAWNDGDLDRYLDLYDESIRLHGYSPEPMTKAEAAGFYGQLFANLDNIQLSVERVVEEGDTIAVHAVMSGTHTGELFGLTNTGIRIHQPVMTMLRFVDGRCTERWSVADTLGVLDQLGAVPRPA